MKAGEMTVGKENILIHGFYIAALVLTLVFNFTVYNKYIWKKIDKSDIFVNHKLHHS